MVEPVFGDTSQQESQYWGACLGGEVFSPGFLAGITQLSHYLVNNWYFNYSNTFRITGEMCVFQLSTAINGQEYGICLLPGL